MNVPGVSRPLRVAGLALLGVAVLALTFGTITAVTGDGDQDTAAPTGEQTTTTTPGEKTEGGSPSPSPSPSPTTPASETTTSAPSATGTTGGPNQGADGPTRGPAPADRPAGKQEAGTGKDGDSLKTLVEVRVYNNSNISGLAERAARDLRARGWNVTEVGNYSDGVIYTTTAYYRPGTNEEAAAQAIGENYSMRVERRFEGIEDASPGVIVIVTKDYAGRKSGK